MELRVEVLGPVRVLRDGAEVDPGGPRQRELLARLAAARGRPVPFDRLADDLWDQPGAGTGDRRGALATFVGDLRRRLEPDRAPRTPPRVLVTAHGGYALRLPDDALDAARLEAAVARATSPPAADAASGTTRALEDAVAAWRGEPYGDLPDRAWVLAERRHLAQVHARAVEALAEGLLAEGRTARAVATLDAHAAAHPWRERAWAWAAAEDAVGLARDLGDPGTLALALNARFLQSFQRPGAGAERERTGAELVGLADAHDLPTFAILGHLVRMQAAAGAGRFADADAHAAAAEDVAAGYESPVVPMLTAWYRAMRDAETAPPDVAARAYRAADTLLAGVRMPGVRDGLLPLALLTVRLRHGRTLTGIAADGPYAPWVEPLLALDAGDRDAAADLARAAPEPPADHLRELRWALAAETAARLGDADLARRARRALARTPDELAGAGSGLVSLGPVRLWLDRLDGLGSRPA
ncbi:hypothetical protein GJV82_02725 [Cellulosimicrobium sp. BIT-GX5]|uniref:OmpR/PhoB-type domain-containing protein n=1 Tax=Cellulosimicrobium composti TaxID=2672572 RepID=A0A6N7ZEL1_9MICO|nr:BTAD domain-containing putative transcriptional regulator [Cellulosimicrobium composti]MTG87873.1 hypothetical protein [Cellulosimicrobium composti]